MITMFAARLLCVLAVLAPVVLTLQPSQAAAQAQLAPVQRAPTYEQQQQKEINAWMVGLAVVSPVYYFAVRSFQRPTPATVG